MLMITKANAIIVYQSTTNGVSQVVHRWANKCTVRRHPFVFLVVEDCVCVCCCSGAEGEALLAKFPSLLAQKPRRHRPPEPHNSTELPQEVLKSKFTSQGSMPCNSFVACRLNIGRTYCEWMRFECMAYTVAAGLGVS